MDWADPANYRPTWIPRSELAISWIGDAKALCDIGCGAPQNIRKLLPGGVLYLPADLKRWTNDTETCDLAAGIFPERSLAKCDVAFLLGVIEYMTEPQKIFSGLAVRCSRLITSYHPTDTHPKRIETWINAFSEREYLSMTETAGLRLVRSGQLLTQRLYEFRGYS